MYIRRRLAQTNFCATWNVSALFLLKLYFKYSIQPLYTDFAKSKYNTYEGGWHKFCNVSVPTNLLLKVTTN
jgi:hypothetical protein